MALSPGTRLGHYDVTALIGEGGMGQVWQATDTQLNRQVALKILPDAFADDPDRLARFQREAQVLASLNHPNIAAIYGIEHGDDTRALVLELVEGPTLADRIAQGAMPIEDALPIARQIAEALEAAHEAGVIHRDLKPANIKVRDDGTVKVLDFGLAKALETFATGAPEQSPTITMAATQMGMIVGTATYMSPEQARGSVVDRRADIWAFGAVFYELLVGKALFDGPTVSDTLALVLTQETDWTPLPVALPESVRRLLRRCLDRDAKHRLRDIGEARVVLEEAIVLPTGDSPASAPARRVIAPWLGGIALGSVLTGLAIVGMTAPGTPPPVGRFAVGLDSTAVFVTGPGPSQALSPDGRELVFVASNDEGDGLFRRALNQLEASPIPGTSGARTPVFSPDGQWVAFIADDLLKKVSLTGGRPITVCEAPGTASGASWGPDDTIVFTLRNAGLMRVSASGGDPEPLTELDPVGGIQDHLWPEITPDGEAVLYTVWSGTLDTSQVAVRSLNGDRQALLTRGSHARYAPTGHLVFARDASLWAAPFDLDEFQLTGPEVKMVDDLLVNTGGGAGQFSNVTSGSLAYVRGGTTSTDLRLTWLDRDGRPESTPTRPADFIMMQLSPSGTEVAVMMLGDTDANSDIWIVDVARGGFRRLTTHPALDSEPLWTPDGTRVVFASLRDGSWGLFWKAVDGSSPTERLTSVDEAAYVRPYGWSPDGTRLVFEFGLRSGADIGVLTMEDGSWAPLVESGASEREPQISPDGQWLAYSSNEAGPYQVYVERFPELGGRRSISAGAGEQPLWSPEGDRLYYIAEATLYAVAVETEPVLTTGMPEALFRWPVSAIWGTWADSSTSTRMANGSSSSTHLASPAARPRSLSSKTGSRN